MAEICLDCIHDEHLRKIAEGESLQVDCRYCGNRGGGVELVQLAAFIEEALQSFATHGEVVTVWDSASGGPVDEQMGYDLDCFLQVECGIDVAPAMDLAVLLEERDPADPRRGEDAFFDREQSFCRRNVYPVDHEYGWQQFSHRIKHERRFFDSEARYRLAEILGEPDSREARELAILEIGPGSPVESVWRARTAASEADALRMIRQPSKHLGPPPPEKAVPGRMNPAGIPVFYGALSKETAVAEVRPWVGGLVVVGRFGPTRTLRLLDLTKLGNRAAGSLFQPGYEARAERLSFLRGFHQLIARPVQPHDELVDYIPTQAVAEYVANVLGLDGMIYASAQTGVLSKDPLGEHLGVIDPDGDEIEKHNVVLLGEAGRLATEAEDSDAQGPEPEFGGTLEYKPQPAPGVLVFEGGSTEPLQVTAVNYQHQYTYVHDPEGKDDV